MAVFGCVKSLFCGKAWADLLTLLQMVKGRARGVAGSMSSISAGVKTWSDSQISARDDPDVLKDVSSERRLDILLLWGKGSPILKACFKVWFNSKRKEVLLHRGSGHSEVTPVDSSAVFRLRSAAAQPSSWPHSLSGAKRNSLGCCSMAGNGEVVGVGRGWGAVHVVNLQLTLPVINPAAFLNKTILLVPSRCALEPFWVSDRNCWRCRDLLYLTDSHDSKTDHFYLKAHLLFAKCFSAFVTTSLLNSSCSLKHTNTNNKLWCLVPVLCTMLTKVTKSCCCFHMKQMGENTEPSLKPAPTCFTRGTFRHETAHK